MLQYNIDMNGFYENTGYVNRHRKQTLILDITDGDGSIHLGSGGNFDIKLYEPLIIDKYSEIYLDSFTTMNSNIVNGSGNGAFLLKIDQFNIRSAVASSLHNNHISQAILIPNEHVNIEYNQTVVMHKAKKFNYVGDIHPTRIGRLTGKITNLHGAPIFHSENTEENKTYALIGIESSNLIVSANYVITNNDSFSLGSAVTSPSVSPAVNGHYLVDTFNTSTSLHFSLNENLSPTSGSFTSGGGNLVFTGSSSHNVTIINNLPDSNPNLMLISNPARFIAEFTINTVE